MFLLFRASALMRSTRRGCVARGRNVAYPSFRASDLVKVLVLLALLAELAVLFFLRPL